MAFNGDNMTPLGGNSRAGENLQGKNAPMAWAYLSSTDTITDILGTGYFDTFNKFLVAGQVIYAFLPDGKFFVTVNMVNRSLSQVIMDPDFFTPTGIDLIPVSENSAGAIGILENYLLFSEDLDNAVWTDPQNNTTVTPNNALDPNGLFKADTLAWDTAGLGLRQLMTQAPAETLMNISFWGRHVTGNTSFRIDVRDGPGQTFTLDSTLKYFSRQITTGLAGSSFMDFTVPGSVGTFELWGFRLTLGALNRALTPYTKTLADMFISGSANNPKVAGLSLIGDVYIDALKFNNGSRVVFTADADTETLGQSLIYACTDTVAPRTLTISTSTIELGRPGTVFEFIVKDESDGARRNNITIDTEGGQTIDGLPEFVIDENCDSVKLYSNGTSLFTSVPKEVALSVGSLFVIGNTNATLITTQNTSENLDVTPGDVALGSDNTSDWAISGTGSTAALEYGSGLADEDFYLEAIFVIATPGSDTYEIKAQVAGNDLADGFTVRFNENTSGGHVPQMTVPFRSPISVSATEEVLFLVQNLDGTDDIVFEDISIRIMER